MCSTFNCQNKEYLQKFILLFFAKGNVLTNSSGCFFEMKVKEECLSWVNHFLKVGLQPFNLYELVGREYKTLVV